MKLVERAGAPRRLSKAGPPGSRAVAAVAGGERELKMKLLTVMIAAALTAAPAAAQNGAAASQADQSFLPGANISAFGSAGSRFDFIPGVGFVPVSSVSGNILFSPFNGPFFKGVAFGPGLRSGFFPGGIQTGFGNGFFPGFSPGLTTYVTPYIPMYGPAVVTTFAGRRFVQPAFGGAYQSPPAMGVRPYGGVVIREAAKESSSKKKRQPTIVIDPEGKERAATRELESLMKERSMVEGIVVLPGKETVTVRYEREGDRVHASYAPDEVFFFNKEHLTTAEMDATLLKKGMKVLVPAK